MSGCMQSHSADRGGFDQGVVIKIFISWCPWFLRFSRQTGICKNLKEKKGGFQYFISWFSWFSIVLVVCSVKTNHPGSQTTSCQHCDTLPATCDFQEELWRHSPEERARLIQQTHEAAEAHPPACVAFCWSEVFGVGVLWTRSVSLLDEWKVTFDEKQTRACRNVCLKTLACRRLL